MNKKTEELLIEEGEEIYNYCEEKEHYEKLAKLGDILLNSYFGGIRSIIVRPELNDITGGFLSTAIFERIMYMSERYEKVWMFTTPNKNKDYRRGRSWCELFNISKYRFNKALKKFAFKLGKTQNTNKKENALVIYYRTNDNKTYYEVNIPLLKLKMAELYKTGKLDYLKI